MYWFKIRMEFLRPILFEIELICLQPAMARSTGVIGVISPAVGCWIGWLGADAVISGKAYEGTCRIPRQNGDGRGIASARFVWIVKATESVARPHVVYGY